MPIPAARAGEPLERSLRIENAKRDAANDYLRRARGGPQSAPAFTRNLDILLCRNDASGSCPRGGALLVDGLVADAGPTKPKSFDAPVLTASKPTWPSAGRIAIALEPIKSGKIGRVAIGGTVLAQVDFTPAGEFVHLVDGSWQLVRATGGDAQLIATGETGYAVIRLGVRQPVWRCTLKEAVGASTAGQASVDLIDLEGTDTGVDVDMLDPDGELDDLSASDPAWCMEAGGKFYALNAACPA